MSTQSLSGTLTEFSITLETIVCCTCGIPFGVPENYKAKLLQTHGRFWCPNGHRLVFNGETKEEKLLRQLKQREDELTRKSMDNIQLETQLTKIKKKVAAGQCPCCDKAYKHLAAHMKNKHPKGF